MGTEQARKARVRAVAVVQENGNTQPEFPDGFQVKLVQRPRWEVSFDLGEFDDPLIESAPWPDHMLPMRRGIPIAIQAFDRFHGMRPLLHSLYSIVSFKVYIKMEGHEEEYVHEWPR